MPTASARKSKVYTISLPPELAQKAYSAQQARRTLDELGDYAAGRNPNGYTEADVPQLIKEVRAQKPRRRRVRSNG